MNMSFQEKSIWICLVVILLISVPYFTFTFSAFFEAFSDPNPDDTNPFLTIPLFIGACVLIAIVVAVLHIVLAIAFYKETEAGEDERDNLIELKATRISYFILVLGVWTTGASMFLFLLFLAKANVFLLPLAMANIIMFFFFLAEIVGWSIQLFYYRRGI
ncbi:hypothetical protein GF407_17345 [candidate division KSB1 bacterium]|nr:hypothetical protein [candidate division KSB1 bacterium]